MRPVRATALYIAWSFKAFALTGRQACVHDYPGRCPGLGASALSGRVGKNLRKFRKKLIVEPLKKRKEKEMKKEVWKTILQMLIAVLTAIGTTLGVTSCM